LSDREGDSYDYDLIYCCESKGVEVVALSKFFLGENQAKSLLANPFLAVCIFIASYHHNFKSVIEEELITK